MTELEMPVSVFDQMVAQARAALPAESCGIFAGSDNRVERLYEMTNIDNSPTHYTMDPAEQFAVIKDVRSAGLEMLAIYHSHPESPARPSAEDIRLALTPDVIYIIVSLLDGNSAVKGFLINDGDVTEVPVTVGGKPK